MLLRPFLSTCTTFSTPAIAPSRHPTKTARIHPLWLLRAAQVTAQLQASRVAPGRPRSVRPQSRATDLQCCSARPTSAPSVPFSLRKYLPCFLPCPLPACRPHYLEPSWFHVRTRIASGSKWPAIGIQWSASCGMIDATSVRTSASSKDEAGIDLAPYLALPSSAISHKSDYYLTGLAFGP